MLQDQSLYTVLKILAPCIVDFRIGAITSNSRLKLANTNINLRILDKFPFKNLNRMQQKSASFLSFLFKIVARVGKCCTVWDKTPVNLNYNARRRSKSSSDDFKIDPKDEIGTMALRDSMPCLVNIKPRQGMVTRNNNLISIMTIYLLSYFSSNKINLF